MILRDEPVQFVEALKQLRSKGILPTDFDTEQMKTVDAAIRRNSFWSAQNTLENILQAEKNVVESILSPTTGASKDRETKENPSGFVESGFNPATARQYIKEHFRAIGYQPAEGTRGSLLDLSSDRRIDLVIETQTRLSQGAGHFVQANADADVVDLWPAWEFLRMSERADPRDWDGANGLWVNACRRADDAEALKVYTETGRMCALKSSEVWDEISDPDYTPGGLDNPYDPVAFGTGMGREEMSRDEAVEVGLIGAKEEARPAAFDLADLFAIPE